MIDLMAMLGTERDKLLARMEATTTAELATARAAFPGQDEKPRLYAVLDGGIALVSVKGALTAEVDFWAWLFGGGATYPQIAQAVAAADADPAVRGLLLDIDSPGGDVAGLLACAQAVQAVRKPKASYVSGLGCSAAYLLAAAAGRIYASPTAVVGCIGVLGTYGTTRKSEYFREFRSEQTPEKALGAETPEGAAQYQAVTNALAKAYLGAVAQARGLASGDAAAEAYGRGATFGAEDALPLGLIDGLAVAPPLDKVLTAAVAPSRAPAASSKGGAMRTRSKGQPGHARAEGDMPAEKPLTEWTPEELIAEVERLRQELADKDAEAADANAVADESAGEVAKLRQDLARQQASLKALETEARTVKAEAFVARHRARGVVAGEKAEAAALKAFLANPELAEETYGSLPDNAAVLRPVGESGTPASVRGGEATTAAGVRALIQARAKDKGITYHAARQQVVSENPSYRAILAQENR